MVGRSNESIIRWPLARWPRQLGGYMQLAHPHERLDWIGQRLLQHLWLFCCWKNRRGVCTYFILSLCHTSVSQQTKHWHNNRWTTRNLGLSWKFSGSHWLSPKSTREAWNIEIPIWNRNRDQRVSYIKTLPKWRPLPRPVETQALPTKNGRTGSWERRN